MSKTILIMFFLISGSYLFAQSFNRYGTADTTKIFAINNFIFENNFIFSKGEETKLIIDSTEIEISIKNYGARIEAINSNSFLKMIFYLKECKLIAVSVKEQSPFFNDLHSFSSFYFESDTIFYSDYYYSIRTCMPIPFEKSILEVYGYNPNFSGEYLQAYIKKLFFRIKEITSKSFTPLLVRDFKTPSSLRFHNNKRN